MLHHPLRSIVVVCALALVCLSPSLWAADEAFVRGSARGTFDLDISDPVFIIGYLFIGGEAPPCLDAADANDDGRINIADTIWLVSHLFGGGHTPSCSDAADSNDDGQVEISTRSSSSTTSSSRVLGHRSPSRKLYGRPILRRPHRLRSLRALHRSGHRRLTAFTAGWPRIASSKSSR